MLILALLLLPVRATPQYYDRCRTPRDLVFIIDHSGTMKNNDPQGLLWIGLRHLINKLAADSDRNDNLIFIPFGSAKDTEKYLTQNGTLRWFKLRDVVDRALLFKTLDRWAKERDHSDSTDILAAFDTFAERFYPSRQRISDLYIFFISDGRMDVGDGRRGEAYRQQAIRTRDQQLYALLQRFQNLWRIYSICVGHMVDENRHRKILSYSQKDRRRSGLPYPPLGHTSPGQPYYLRINEGDPRSNMALLMDSIWDVLDIGDTELYRGRVGSTGATFPPAAVEDYRFQFTLDRPVFAHEFLKYINLAYRIDKELQPARLLVENLGTEDETSPYLDYRIDTKYIAQAVGGTQNLSLINEWKLEVGELPRDMTVVNLQVVQRHGWRVFIDSLRIEPMPLPQRFFDRFFNTPQPCSATLWVSGRIYNACGRQNINDQNELTLVINNGKPYQLKIERESTYDQVTAEPSFLYHWQTPEVITGDPAFANNLGSTVTIGLKFLTSNGSFFYLDHSITVPVCAEYESVRRIAHESHGQ
jgi:hypothetical protein